MYITEQRAAELVLAEFNSMSAIGWTKSRRHDFHGFIFAISKVVECGPFWKQLCTLRDAVLEVAYGDLP